MTDPWGKNEDRWGKSGDGLLLYPGNHNGYLAPLHLFMVTLLILPVTDLPRM